MNRQQPPALLTVAEYAAIVRLSPKTVRRQIRRRELPAMNAARGGRRPAWRIPVSVLPAPLRPAS